MFKELENQRTDGRCVNPETENGKIRNASPCFLVVERARIRFHPYRRHAYHHRVSFHFVSDEGKVVEAELNMPRGLQ